MFEIQASVEINRSPREVFEYVTDPAKIPEWQPAIKVIAEITPGSLGVGTQYVEEGRIGFVQTAVAWEIIEFDPGVSCTFRSDSFLALNEVTFSVSELGAGTLFEAAQRADPKWPFKLVEPLLKRQTLQFRRTYLAAIKQILEARS